MTTTRKRLTDEERIAQAQAKADAVKARIEAKQAKAALAMRTRELRQRIGRDDWEGVVLLMRAMEDEACRLGGIDTVES